MSANELRYRLLRYGNEDHRLDRQILHHGWFPKGVNPRVWVYRHGSLRPVYSQPATTVLAWPIALTLLSAIGCFIWGARKDYQWQEQLVGSGVHLDGTVVATVDEYNQEVKGDGMIYGVYEWSER
jgi:hypothetical protein